VRGFGPERRVIGALRSHPDDPERALRAAGRSFRLLAASSAQSALFNAVLDARAAALGLHALRPGDLAQGPYGGVFRCRAEALPELLERAAPGRLEVAATGPLPGHSSFEPAPEIAAEERAWTRELDLDWAWFDSGPLASPGTRRPLIVPLLEPPELVPLADTQEGVCELRFALPKGAYATELLHQLGIRGRTSEERPERD
jgi:tRNA(Glu) U13 pseudouridine synthase TruD